MTRRKYVDVNVSWCYGDCSPTVKIPLREWDRIVAGVEVGSVTAYWYEGERYGAYFAFNYAGRGTLKVSYGDDGGEGFIGTINDATITGGEFPDDEDR